MSQPTRRQILAATGSVAATALATKAFPFGVQNGVDETIKVALVGAGGRGSGAALNAVSVKQGPVKLVAMADVFEDRLNSSYENLQGAMKDKMDVPKERRFLGFDAYKHAMDCLRPGDIVILTTPPAFRWVHFAYAIEKKLNVFMEKPVTVDGPSARKMLELNEKAKAAGLKVGVGLMSRHSIPLQELHARSGDGELGEIMYMRGYRMHGPAATSHSLPKPASVSDLEYQIRRFHSFLWCSGGCFNDFYIHIIDHFCWMKNALPISAMAVGGKHFREDEKGVSYVDQNLDCYAVEYTFADGTKAFFDGRNVNGAHGQFSSYVHGTKGFGIASRANDCGGPSATYSSQMPDPAKLIWQSTDNSNPYQNEWEVLVDSIRNNKPFNEVQRGVDVSTVSSMGRMSAHTGQLITFDDMLNCEHEFAPGIESMSFSGPAPVQMGQDGKYPVPQPGRLAKREY